MKVRTGFVSNSSSSSFIVRLLKTDGPITVSSAFNKATKKNYDEPHYSELDSERIKEKLECMGWPEEEYKEDWEDSQWIEIWDLHQKGARFLEISIPFEDPLGPRLISILEALDIVLLLFEES